MQRVGGGAEWTLQNRVSTATQEVRIDAEVKALRSGRWGAELRDTVRRASRHWRPQEGAKIYSEDNDQPLGHLEQVNVLI